MPRSSGTYTPPAGNPVVAGTVISSAVQNNTINDIGNELTNSLPRDGTAPPTANIPMGNFKITGIGAATLATDVPQYQQIQSGASLYLTAVAGTNAITGTLSSPTLAAYAAGNTFRFTAAGANTGAVTLNINGLGAKAITKNGTTALIAGDIPSGAFVEVGYDGTQFQLINVSTASFQAPFIDSTALVKGSADATKLLKIEVDGFTTATTRTVTPPDKDITLPGLVDIRSYLAGCTLSTAGSSATMSIAAGTAIDSTNVVAINLAASISKTTSAWAVGTGNGGLDTGAIANSTWYHFYLIRRPDTGVVDVTFSTNATSPTLPANYTQYRRIGSGRTNGSAQWTSFVQDGDDFTWLTQSADVSGAASTASRTLYTLLVPLGVRVKAKVSIQHTGAVTATQATLLTDPNVTDVAASTSSFTIVGSNQNATANYGAMAEVYTNTSSQIGARSNFANNITINTSGWKDSRGKDA